MRVADDLALLVGRLLMASLFLPAGIGKAMGFSGFAASLAAKGLPMPELFAVLAVAIEIGGPIALILGIAPRIVALVMIAFLIMATGTSHVFWTIADAAPRAAQQGQFLKNMGLIAGFLFYFVAGAGAYSLDRVFSASRRAPARA